MIPLSAFSDELIKMAEVHRPVQKNSSEGTVDRNHFRRRLEEAEKTAGPLDYHPALSMEHSVFKVAGVVQAPEDVAGREGGITGQQAAVGAAAASPFAGLIGQRRLRHDPLRRKDIKRYSTMGELGRLAQEGDVILTSKKGGPWKGFQAPLSGSEFYHAQPVIGRRGGMGTTASAGDYLEGYHSMMPAGEFKHEVDTIPKAMKEGKYSDFMILRPKEKMTPEQMKVFRERLSARVQSPYDMERASGAYFRDIFVPKVGPFKRSEEATEVKFRNMKDPETGKIRKVPVRCKGNVCSTAPAMAFTEATGKSVIPGKAAQDMLPADFLRSKEFTPVGVHFGQNYKARRFQPYLARAGIGAGLAGATYAVSEDPALAAGGAGIAGATMAQKAYLRHKAKKQGLSEARIQTRLKNFPNIKNTIDNLMNLDPGPKRNKAVRDFLSKNVSVKALGAAGAYALAKKLTGGSDEAEASQ